MARPVFVHRLGGTFIQMLLDDAERAQFLEYFSRPMRVIRSWFELTSVIACQCEATPQELQRAVELLEQEEDHELAQMIARELRTNPRFNRPARP